MSEIELTEVESEEQDEPLLQEGRLQNQRLREVRSYCFLRRAAVLAVHRGFVWQSACILSAFATAVSVARATFLWIGMRYYIRRSYMAIPFAAQCLFDTTMLLFFVMAEPNTVPKRSSNESREGFSRHSDDNNDDNEDLLPPRRMDRYMTHVFSQKRRKKRFRRLERQGINRLGLRIPVTTIRYITPRRRFACSMLAVWALTDAAAGCFA